MVELVWKQSDTTLCFFSGCWHPISCWLCEVSVKPLWSFYWVVQLCFVFYMHIVFVRCVFVFGHMKTIFGREGELIDSWMSENRKRGHCCEGAQSHGASTDRQRIFHIQAEIKFEKKVFGIVTSSWKLCSLAVPAIYITAL